MNIKDLLSEYLEKNNIKLGNLEKSSNLYFENEPFYYLVLFLRNEYIFQNNPEII